MVTVSGHAAGFLFEPYFLEVLLLRIYGVKEFPLSLQLYITFYVADYRHVFSM